MSNSVFLSVIVPVYKQEKTIIEDISRIANVLSNTPYTFEIIPVVDGTRIDKSLQRIKSIKHSNVFATGYSENRGKGYAVRYGMKEARGEVITFIDSGMDIDPRGIVMLLEHMIWYNADIIIGSKLHAASVVEYPWWRKMMTLIYYFIVKLLFGLKVRDTQTGLKAYKRKVLERVLPRLLVKQFAFDIEILAVAYHLGFKRIYDAPVKVDLDWKKSSLKLWGGSGAWRVLVDTLAVFYRLRIIHYYDEGYKKNRVFDKVLNMLVPSSNS